jgi:response regulator of citrate/malate metabolism
MNAVDYLLQPFSKERFDQALEKAAPVLPKQVLKNPM